MHKNSRFPLTRLFRIPPKSYKHHDHSIADQPAVTKIPNFPPQKQVSHVHTKNSDSFHLQCKFECFIQTQNCFVDDCLVTRSRAYSSFNGSIDLPCFFSRSSILTTWTGNWRLNSPIHDSSFWAVNSTRNKALVVNLRLIEIFWLKELRNWNQEILLYVFSRTSGIRRGRKINFPSKKF